MIQNMDAERLGTSDELQKTRMIEGLASGLTGAQAAKQAGYGAADQRTPWKIIPPDELRARFQQIAIEKGLTLHRVADKIAEHLEARQNQSSNGKEITVSNAPDNRVQQKAIEQLATLLGINDQTKQVQVGSSISLTITGPAAERLTQLLSGE